MTKCLGLVAGFVQRTKNHSVQARSTYQYIGIFRQNGRIKDVRGSNKLFSHHQFLPPKNYKGPPRGLDEWLTSAQTAERRRDAVEARTLEITLPRLPDLLNLQICRAIAALFENFDVYVQLDFHVTLSDDDFTNPHLHLMFNQRSWTDGGWAPTKNADLEELFRDGRIRGLRRRVAAIINEHAEANGFPKQVHIESNYELDLPTPEPRLYRSVFRYPERPSSRSAKEMLRLARLSRTDEASFFELVSMMQDGKFEHTERRIAEIQLIINELEIDLASQLDASIDLDGEAHPPTHEANMVDRQFPPDPGVTYEDAFSDGPEIDDIDEPTEDDMMPQPFEDDPSIEEYYEEDIPYDEAEYDEPEDYDGYEAPDY